jgi:FeS assembly SUF system protein
MAIHDDGLTLRDFLPGAPTGDGDITARAGKPLPAGSTIAGRDAVITAMRTVHDPEIPVNIYDLGLIYGIEIGADGAVHIDMTLTAPACPVAGIMPQQIADAVAAVPGVGTVEIRLVWEPPWTRDRMTDEAKLALDLF